VKAGKTAKKQVHVLITDHHGNGVKGRSVTQSDAGAHSCFNPDPAVTFVKGVAGSRYTTPSQTGTVSVTASADELDASLFRVTVD